jgi:hypothetical protein
MELYYEVKIYEIKDKKGKNHNIYVIRTRENLKSKNFRCKFYGEKTTNPCNLGEDDDISLKLGDIVYLEEPENTKVEIIKILQQN